MSDKTKENLWVEVAPLSDLSDVAIGEVLSIDVEENNGVNHSIALIRLVEQEWSALENVCTHDNGPLADGIVNLTECSVECRRHGARFHMKTGEVISMPAIHPIRTYVLKVESGILYIQL